MIRKMPTERESPKSLAFHQFEENRCKNHKKCTNLNAFTRSLKRFAYIEA